MYVATAGGGSSSLPAGRNGDGGEVVGRKVGDGGKVRRGKAGLFNYLMVTWWFTAPPPLISRQISYYYHYYFVISGSLKLSRCTTQDFINSGLHGATGFTVGIYMRRAREQVWWSSDHHCYLVHHLRTHGEVIKPTRALSLP